MEQLDRVLPRILSNECALFIGAGISKIAGCYDWDSIVKKLMGHPSVQVRIREDDIPTTGFDNEELIEYCRKVLKSERKEEDYWGILREAICKDPSKYQEIYLPLVKAIKRITPFPGVITTNIDSCLEDSGLFPFSKIYYELCDFVIVKFRGEVVFHIHGYVEKFKDALWTRSQYIVQYGDENFKRFLSEIFSAYSVMFLGYSLAEDAIRNVILEARKINPKIEHFALIPENDNINKTRISIFKELYGINVISYGLKSELHQILSRWVEKYFAKVSVEPPKEEASVIDEN